MRNFKLLAALVFLLPVLFTSLKHPTIIPANYYLLLFGHGISENTEEINNLLSSVKAAAITWKRCLWRALMKNPLSWKQPKRNSVHSDRASKLEMPLQKTKTTWNTGFSGSSSGKMHPRRWNNKMKFQKRQLLKAHYKTLPSIFSR